MFGKTVNYIQNFVNCLLNCLKGAMQKLTGKQLLSMDKELFNGLSPFAIFCGCIAYFDVHSEVSIKIYSPKNSYLYTFH